ncbi:EamA family transporter [Pseudomonas sp.]|uniref:EamA family transporter n=1 Tax=Pseudomonas sp. TaxID=306 RepID=UPI003523CF13
MKTTQTRPTWLDALSTALAPVIWGSTYIVTTELLPPGLPFTAALLRTLPAGILLVLFSRRRPKRAEWGRLAILAALNIGFFQALLFVAAYRLPGGLAAVVGAIQPLLIMALVWLFDRHPPAQLAVLASIVGIAGMAALLLAPGATWDPLGIAAAFAGTACMATGTYLTRRWRPTLPLLAFTGWQLLVGGLLLLPVAYLVDPPLPTLSLTQVLAYAYLSLFGALLAYVLWFRGVARLAPVAVSSLSLLSPLVAVVIGWALLGQSMTGLSLAGLMAVLGSILAVQWASTSREPTATAKAGVATPPSQGLDLLSTAKNHPFKENSMSNLIKNLIEARVSTSRYHADRQLSDQDISELVRLATRAPSAYNFQNWKFIAVRTPQAKARLQAVAYGQQQVADASVTFIICGTLAAHESLAQTLQPAVDAGILDQATQAGWVAAAQGSHPGNPQLQRDEALRSASLAAMTLMLAAQGMGLSTGAMSGFDAQGVTREFGLAANEVPVILITVGYPAAGNWPQKPRKALHEVLEFA